MMSIFCWLNFHASYLLQDLTNNDISDDIECARQIYDTRGFLAFPEWQIHCTDSEKLKRLFVNLCLPSENNTLQNATVNFQNLTYVY